VSLLFSKIELYYSLSLIGAIVSVSDFIKTMTIRIDHCFLFSFIQMFVSPSIVPYYAVSIFHYCVSYTLPSSLFSVAIVYLLHVLYGFTIFIRFHNIRHQILYISHFMQFSCDGDPSGNTSGQNYLRKYP
jgi:hypothetical protein